MMCICVCVYHIYPCLWLVKLLGISSRILVLIVVCERYWEPNSRLLLFYDSPQNGLRLLGIALNFFWGCFESWEMNKKIPQSVIHDCWRAVTWHINVHEGWGGNPKRSFSRKKIWVSENLGGGGSNFFKRLGLSVVAPKPECGVTQPGSRIAFYTVLTSSSSSPSTTISIEALVGL